MTSCASGLCFRTLGVKGAVAPRDSVLSLFFTTHLRKESSHVV